MQFKCKLCNKEFRNKNNLHVHLNVIHGIKHKDINNIIIINNINCRKWGIWEQQL